MDLFARRAQREGQRKAGVHVEPAARTGDENPPGIAKTCEEGGLCEGEHRGTVTG
jgi:hypothetical protein